jgi:hypothetical protein
LAIVALDDFLNYYRLLGMLGPDNLLEFAERPQLIGLQNESYGRVSE